MGYPPWKSAMDRVLSWALWVLAIPAWKFLALALLPGGIRDRLRNLVRSLKVMLGLRKKDAIAALKAG